MDSDAQNEEGVDSSQWASVSTDYWSPGATWEYHQAVYNMLDFANRWPQGMSAHFSWPGSDGWRIVGLWKSQWHHEKYFSTVVAEEVTRAVGQLGAISNQEGATDVEPVLNPVRELIVGPLARNFVDIGPDLEGTAVYVLESEPVAIEIDVSGMDAQDYSLLVDRLGYRPAIPSGLIAHFALEIEGGTRIFEIWSNLGDAEKTLVETLLPAIESVAVQTAQELTCDQKTHDLRRIIFSDEVVQGFGF